VRHPDTVADTALAAAQAQHITLPGQDTAAGITADLAAEVLALDDRLKQLDRQIREASAPTRRPPSSSRCLAWARLGAEFLVATGDLASHPDAGHLASAAGLVPVPKDSGRRTGNLHRPQRYSRRLRRVFYLSAQTSIIRDGPNQTYYLKKRAEGHKHIPAVIALARRRVNVLWALLRDNRHFTTNPPPPASAATAA
jgi:transposase